MTITRRLRSYSKANALDDFRGERDRGQLAQGDGTANEAEHT